MSVRSVNVYVAREGARPCAAVRGVLGGVPALLVSTLVLGPAVRAAGPAPAAAPSVPSPGGSPGGPPLDLRLGDLRRYVPPEALYAPWTDELDEVLVRSHRRPPDLPERRAVPQGLGGLFWAARRPTESWRLFVPDPNAAAVPPRSPDDPQPPPGSWRLRLDQNGKVW